MRPLIAIAMVALCAIAFAAGREVGRTTLPAAPGVFQIVAVSPSQFSGEFVVPAGGGVRVRAEDVCGPLWRREE